MEIESLIIALGSRAHFVGKANSVRIDYIEKQLNVILPKSYKLFLKEYGLAVLPGFTILGNGLATVASCVETTLDWRRYGLSKSLVVIEDDGTDWIYCLDTSRLKMGECPVVDWEQNRGIGNVFFENFLVFFESRLNESLSFK